MICYDLSAGTSPKQKFYFGSFSESPAMCQVNVNSPPPRLFSGGLKTLSVSHGPRTEALWNDRLHFLVPSLWPCSLSMFPLCTICPQCWPQAQLGLAMLSSGSTYKDPPVLGSLLWFLYSKIIPPALVGVPE